MFSVEFQNDKREITLTDREDNVRQNDEAHWCANQEWKGEVI